MHLSDAAAFRLIVRNYLYQQDDLELIAIDIKVSGGEDRMVFMTKDGLEEIKGNNRKMISFAF